MTRKIEVNAKAPKFKIGDRIKIIKYKNIFSKCCTENWLKEIVIDSVLKTNPWTDKIKDLNGKKFYEKELLLSKLLMSYYPEPDSHIRDEVKVVLNLSNYATKKIRTSYKC